MTCSSESPTAFENKKSSCHYSSALSNDVNKKILWHIPI